MSVKNQTIAIPKQKWVDYSSNSSSQLQESQASIIANPQLQKLSKIDPNLHHIWLEVNCRKMVSHAAISKIQAIRYQDAGNAVYKAKNFDGFDIKVPIKRAQQYLKSGIPGVFGVIIIISQANFNKQQPRDRNQSKKRKTVSENHNKITGIRSPNCKNIKYVDKQTKQLPNNRQIFQQRILEQEQRKYSRRQTSRIGEKLANFRNNKKSEQLINSLKNDENSKAIKDQYLIRNQQNFNKNTDIQRNIQTVKSQQKIKWVRKISEPIDCIKDKNFNKEGNSLKYTQSNEKSEELATKNNFQQKSRKYKLKDEILQKKQSKQSNQKPSQNKNNYKVLYRQKTENTEKDEQKYDKYKINFRKAEQQYFGRYKSPNNQDKRCSRNTCSKKKYEEKHSQQHKKKYISKF